MSKAIYTLKLHLLSETFRMSEEELNCVKDMAVFIAIFYVKIWFQSTFAVSAARNDLQFMANMLRYRMYKPLVAFTILQSCKRHLWYICPQLIVLALCDEGLDGRGKVLQGLSDAVHN